MEIEIRGNEFHLLPQKAIFWKNKNTLLISDLHLGKITHFRNSGIALPSVALLNNFDRLDQLIHSNQVNRLILLGDLFHNIYNKEWEHFISWRNKNRELEVNMILGNHDILPLKLFNEINIKVADYLSETGFLFLHHPVAKPDKDHFIFCGHVHPVFCFRSNVQSIRLSCFVIDNYQAILPSFGVFTGGYEMKRQAGRKIFVITANEVLKAV